MLMRTPLAMLTAGGCSNGGGGSQVAVAVDERHENIILFDYASDGLQLEVTEITDYAHQCQIVHP
jgi:hypothetical protein